MSEPNKLKLKQIVSIFLETYNKENKTNYYWDEKKSYNANSSDKAWADAIVFNKDGKELAIQYKEVVWDALYDKIRSNSSRKVVDALIETLTNRGLNEYSIHLNFYQKHIPTNDKDIREFCFWVSELAALKTSEAYPKSLHLFLIPNTLYGIGLKLFTSVGVFLRGIKDSFYIATDRDKKVRQHVYHYDMNDGNYLEKIMKITSYITIFRDPKQKIPVIGWGYSELAPRPLPHYGDVVISEIERKVINKYSNQVVLLDCNRPIDSYDFKLIEDQIHEMALDCEIWLIENFVSKKAATQLVGKQDSEQ